MASVATAPARILPLEGALNLRDMGGYPVAGGGHVKMGMLYRSGTMHRLTAADEAHLAGLGIRIVCDMRRPVERRMHPTRWATSADIPIWSRDYAETSGQLSETIKRTETTAASMRAAMLTLYRDILTDHAASFRAIFGYLKAGEVPMLFNCAAGKDRTGVAGALILEAIGVDRATVLEDYLLTNEADFAAMYRDAPESGLGKLARVAPEALAPVMAADAEYLATMYGVLDGAPGGVAAYLAGLGVDEGARAQLRDLLVA